MVQINTNKVGYFKANEVECLFNFIYIYTEHFEYKYLELVAINYLDKAFIIY